ncbi:MAG: tetratricopeptide repeat protein [Chloroflexota bacterium]|nr:tetratricopeptide repeat protein [Chloroflexota bacterium]
MTTPLDKTKESSETTGQTPAQRLGSRLRQARLRLNMTQSEVAAANFSVSYISAVERGQIRPSLGALEVLSDRLEVPLEDLLGNAPISSVGGGVSRDQAADRRQEEAEARLNTAEALHYQRRYQASIDAVRAISLSHLSTASALEARRLMAASYIELGQAEQARKEAADGITAAERNGDEEARARLRNELGNAYLLSRRNQLALEQYQLAFDAVLHDLARDPLFKINLLYNLGTVNWLLGHTEDSVGYLRQAVDLAKDVNAPERLGDSLWTLSAAYSSQGDTARARKYAARSLAAYERAANETLTSRAYTRLGRGTAQAGDVAEALGYLETARTLAERQGDTDALAEAQRTLAAVYVGQNKLKDADAAIQSAMTLAESSSNAILRAESLLTLAALQQAQKHPKEAETSYESALAMLQDADAPQDLADAYAQYSAFLEQRGEGSRALDLLKQAWRLRENLVKQP